VKILLADDHGLLLAGVRKALEADGFEIVGEASSGPALAALRPVEPLAPGDADERREP